MNNINNEMTIPTNESPSDLSLSTTTLPTPSISTSFFRLFLTEVLAAVAPPTLPLTESAASKIEAMGYKIGQALLPITLTPSVSTPPPSPSTINVGHDLSLIKHLCKDIWASNFGHQITKLQTNHRGVFVSDPRLTIQATSRSPATQYRRRTITNVTLGVSLHNSLYRRASSLGAVRRRLWRSDIQRHACSTLTISVRLKAPYSARCYAAVRARYYAL